MTTASFDSPKAAASARLERLRGFLETDPDNVSLLVECGDVALDLGLAKEAHAWLTKALALRAQDPFLLARLANAKLGMGEHERALELLEPLAKSHPGEPAILYSLGYALLRAGRYAEARDALASIAGDPAAPANTRTLLMRTLHHLGDMPGAIEQAKQVAEARPEDPVAAGALSLLYLDHADYAEARRWSERALQGQPENLDALLAAGTLAAADEKQEAAEQAFRKALELSPANGRAWTGLGMAAMMRFDLAAARTHFERALADTPGQHLIWNALAWCQMLQKDYVGARASLDRSMAINRNIGDTHGALAMLAILQGRAEESRQHGKRALALDPASFGARYADVLRKHPGEREVTEEALRRGFAAVAAPGGGSLADLYERMRARRAQGGKGAKT